MPSKIKLDNNQTTILKLLFLTYFRLDYALIAGGLLFLSLSFLAPEGFCKTQPLQPRFEEGTSQIGVDSPSRLPPLQIHLRHLQGTINYQAPEDTGWKKITKGKIIEPGSYLSTTRGATAGLQIPGISYIQLKPQTDLVINSLIQKNKVVEPVFRSQKKTFNTIDLELIRGKIQAGVRFREKINTSFKVKTKTAIAGLRGTTFQCQTTMTGKTRCGVFRGEVTFSNRFHPEKQITLRSGNHSRIGNPEAAPSPPLKLTDEQKLELSKFSEKAKKHLRLPPAIHSLKLNGEQFRKTAPHRYQITYPYTKQDRLIITGHSKTRAPQAELKKLTAHFNGKKMAVNGLKKWELNVKPQQVPAPGEKKILQGRIIATDSRLTRSLPTHFTVILKHPERKGAIPDHLEPGTVPIKPRQIGQTNYAKVKFPRVITNRDLSRLPWAGFSDTRILDPVSGLTISGLAKADTNIAGVAYSLDGGRTWLSATGKRYWSFELKEKTLREEKKLKLLVVAWTTAGKVGKPIKIGPIIYREEETPYPLSYRAEKFPIEIKSIAGRRVENFPVTVTSSSLLGRPLTVSGTAGDTGKIEKVLYRINNSNWREAKGKENWQFTLHSDKEARFQIELMAWNEQGKLSKTPIQGPIKYRITEKTLPRNYKRGTVKITVSDICGYSYDKIETPFQLFRDDAPGGKIIVRGTARADQTIQGIAYSPNNGKDWHRARGGENWSFTLSGEAKQNFDRVKILAWTTGGVVGTPLKIKEFKYTDKRYSAQIKEIFSEQWRQIEQEDSKKFFKNISRDFSYTDDITGVQKDKSDFKRLLEEIFQHSRGFNVNYNVHSIIANRSGGQMEFTLEIKGMANNFRRPFLIKGFNSEQQFRRTARGNFKITALNDLPLIVYLYNKEKIRIPDLEGLKIHSLSIPRHTSEADILAELSTPNFAVNTLKIGGEIAEGGIKKIPINDFNSARHIPDINNSYQKTVNISENKFYAINVQDQRGKQSVALIKVTRIRPDYAGIKILSPRAAPGLPKKVYTRFRGVSPFE